MGIIFNDADGYGIVLFHLAFYMIDINIGYPQGGIGKDRRQFYGADFFGKGYSVERSSMWDSLG